MRQASLPHLGARVLQTSHDVLDDFPDGRVDALVHELGDYPDSESRDTPFQILQVVRDLDVGARGIAGVVASDGLQEERCVADITGHGPDLVQRRGEGYEAVARDPPVGWLQADDAAKGGGLPDGAAGVGA